MALVLKNSDQVYRFIEERESAILALTSQDKWNEGEEIRPLVVAFCGLSRRIIRGVILESDVEIDTDYFAIAKRALVGNGKGSKGKVDKLLGLSEASTEAIKSHIEQINKLVFRVKYQVEAFLKNLSQHQQTREESPPDESQLSSAPSSQNDTDPHIDMSGFKNVDTGAQTTSDNDTSPNPWSSHPTYPKVKMSDAEEKGGANMEFNRRLLKRWKASQAASNKKATT